MNIFGTIENLVVFPSFNSSRKFNRVAKEASKEMSEKKHLLNFKKLLDKFCNYG